MQPISSETVFRGRVVRMTLKRFRSPEGGEYERDIVEHPGAVGILAHDDEFVYLVSQPREAVGAEHSVEIPAGTLEPGEEPLRCAHRELAEEVGLAAAEWRHLHTIEMTPGYSDERLTLFEATQLSPTSGAEPDEDERIEIVRLPLAELERALAGISDAKTLIALLILAARRP